jgi:hypothetical protein
MQIIMKANVTDVFDYVVDGILGIDELKQIQHQMYLDKNGGELSDLWANDEFMSCLENQLVVYGG